MMSDMMSKIILNRNIQVALLAKAIKTARRVACSEGFASTTGKKGIHFKALRTAQEHSGFTRRQGLSRHILPRFAQSGIPRPLTCLNSLN